MKLSKNYNFKIELHIDYINIPNDKYISRADSIINIACKATGFYLFTKKIHTTDIISVDLKNIHFSKNNRNKYYSKINLFNIAEHYIDTHYPFAEQTDINNKDYLYIELDYAFSKKIPIKARYSFTLEKQFYLYDSVRIIPDSITVYGSKAKINKLESIETDSMSFTNLKESVEDFLKIKDERSYSCRFSHNNVKIIIPIEKFTETELTIPIRITDNNLKHKIKIFPETVKVFAMVATKDYNNITPEMFRVTIDTTDMNKKNSLAVVLQSAPSYVKVNRITPETVEFIFIK